MEFDMKLGIGGGLGPFRAGISTRGIGVGLGPFSTGSSFRRRRRRGSGGDGATAVALLMFLTIAALAVVTLAAITVLVGVVLGVTYAIPASRPWSRSTARSLLDRRARVSQRATEVAAPTTPTVKSPTAASAQDVTGTIDAALPQADLCQQLADASGLFRRRKVLPPTELIDTAAPGGFRRQVTRPWAVHQARASWRLNTSQQVHTTYQHKTNAGARRLHTRQPTRLTLSRPRALQLGPVIPTLTAGQETLYFLPTGILRQRGRRHFDIAPYASVRTECQAIRFIEESQVPGDADQIDSTWQYVNVKGGPDRRYKNNRRLPIMRYGELRLEASNGLQWHIHVSRPDAADRFAAFLQVPRATETTSDPEEQSSPGSAEGRISMGILQRLRTAVPAQRTEQSVQAQLYDGDGLNMEVVGEASYQPALDQCFRRFKSGYKIADLHVLMVPEPGNAYDANAVAVVSPFGTVGYLSRENAAAWQTQIIGASLRHEQPIALAARIYRGEVGVYGIWLDWPADGFVD